MAFNILHTSHDTIPDQNNILESTLEVIPKSDIGAQLDELKRILAEQVLIDAIKSEFGEDEYESDLKNEKLNGLGYSISLKPGKDNLIKDAILTLAGKNALKKYNENTILNIGIYIIIKDNTPFILNISTNDNIIYEKMDL